MRQDHPVAQAAETAAGNPRRMIHYVIAPFLLKLAKHLALLACLIIVGRATGRFAASELAIFLFVFAAALLHILGRRFSPSLPVTVPRDRRAT